MWNQCAVCAAGTVHCAGSAAYDALGAEVEGSRGHALVRGVENAVEVVLGLAFGCARTRSGEVWCWGWNRRGQLGRVLAPGQEATWRGAAVERLDGIEALAAGREHVCALRQGQVWCWGGNDFGQRGADGGDSARPRPVAGIDDAVQIVAGLDLSCARLATGEVACWGDNRAGQLGTAEAERAHVPVFAPEVADAVDVATDGVRVCALERDRVVRCWGGRKDATASMLHQRFAATGGQRVFVVEDGICVVTANARLDCTGLGHDAACDAASLSMLGPVRSLSTIYDGGGCAVLADGGVRCWGIDEGDNANLTGRDCPGPPTTWPDRVDTPFPAW